jgi:four helix bundle suffix protein
LSNTPQNGRNAKNESDGNHDSHHSHSSQDPERLLPPRGDYKTLLSFQKAEVVYDITFRFAHKYLIHQANFLIDRQLLRLENDFIEQGGLRERMTRVRLAQRNRKDRSP